MSPTIRKFRIVAQYNNGAELLILGHTIAVYTTTTHEAHFRRACGTARYAYNWGLAAWQRMHAAGEKPSAQKIKAAWNAHRKAELPWTFEVSKCVSGQSIIDLGTAFTNFFRDCKKPKKQRRFRYPKFKSKRSDNGGVRNPRARFEHQAGDARDRNACPAALVDQYERLIGNVDLAAFQKQDRGAFPDGRGLQWNVSHV